LNANGFSAQELRQELEDSHQKQLNWLFEEVEVLFNLTPETEEEREKQEQNALQMAFYFRKCLKEPDHYMHNFARMGLSLIEGRFPAIYQVFLNTKSA
jgi:L-arabinose isomerase